MGHPPLPQGEREKASPHIVIAASEFHKPLVEKLLEGALMVLKEARVEKSQIEIRWAPGAFELPLLAKRMIRRFHPRAAICLGAIIKGDTSHWRVISQACANGCQKVSLMTDIPVAFGVLTCETAEQAYERCGGKINRGAEAARAALRASRVLRRV